MGDLIDLAKRRNRQILGWDIWLGTRFFSECYPTEPVSSYVWRKKRTRWIAFINWLFRDPSHCETSYNHSQQHAFDAPEYRK